jgi:hypothetical protein
MEYIYETEAAITTELYCQYNTVFSLQNKKTLAQAHGLTLSSDAVENWHSSDTFSKLYSANY